MHASDIVEEYPVVTLDTDVLSAARTIGEQRLPAVIVCDAEGRPHTILPSSQVLRFMIPTYVQEDPALARVYLEGPSEKLMSTLAARVVRDLLPTPQDRDSLPVVEPEATLLEVAVLMARRRSPIAAVMDGDVLLGAITVSRVLQVLLPPAPTSSPASPS